MSEKEALRKVLDAIVSSGNLRACARAVAGRRGWKPVYYTGTAEVNQFLTLQQWTANLAHMLNAEHRYQFALADHLLCCEVLGFDPLRQEDFGEAA